jgi:hypothetical protein
MKQLIVAIVTIGVIVVIVKNLHDDGTMLLASIAEEYSICTNVNLCSDDDLAEMADVLVRLGEHRSKVGLSIVLGWQMWKQHFLPQVPARSVSPATYVNAN